MEEINPNENYHVERERRTDEFSRGTKSEFSVILRDLSYFCTEEHLRALIYCVLGQHIKVYIPQSKETQPRSLLYGFAELQNSEQVNIVISQLNGKDFMGRTLK
jgi:RNA recognition motif-containing protein